jgi:hypothetical protein
MRSTLFGDNISIKDFDIDNTLIKDLLVQW